ncbi:hypothetical protein BG011_007635 [Mortierella polycephala]|uniref:F-box domain-containing protein n=1 Tax=Mortierella polycephala TaxID=41804 RepID=A0A9P6PS52_9FUNG|nr:hypothetical protein BG011_007635 [Mortierella polycephala]
MESPLPMLIDITNDFMPSNPPVVTLPTYSRSPFMLPELDRLIASHLDRVTLSNASRVCKLWHTIFNPVLWKRLSLQHISEDDAYDEDFNFISRASPPSSLPSLPSSWSSTWSGMSDGASSPMTAKNDNNATTISAVPSLTFLQQAFLYSSRNKVLKGLLRYGPLVQELKATGMTDDEMELIGVLCPNLRVLELVGGRYTAESLTDLFQKRQGSIQVVRFHSCVQLRDIFQPLTRLSNLRELELYGSFVGNTITSPTFFKHDLFPMLSACPLLHALVIEQVYIIDQRLEQDQDGWDGGSNSAPLATLLPLTGSSTASSLSLSAPTSMLSAQLNSAASGAALRTLAPSTSSLKSLALDCGDIPESVIMALLKRCPLLETLSLDWSRELTDSSLSSLHLICPNLTAISLCRCEQLTAEGFKALFRSYPNLISIDLNGNVLSDAILEDLTQSCQFLRHLSINNCQSLTDLGIQAVLLRCSNLEFFSLRSVPGLSPLLFDDITAPSSSTLSIEAPQLTRAWACRNTLQSFHLPDLISPSRPVLENFRRQYTSLQNLHGKDDAPWQAPEGNHLMRSRFGHLTQLKHLTFGGQQLDMRIILEGLYQNRYDLETLRITKLRQTMTSLEAQWLLETAAPNLRILAIPKFGNRAVTEWIDLQRPGLLSFEKW